ncbi:MAG: ArsA family ATPase [Actinomycetota bacterium]
MTTRAMFDEARLVLVCGSGGTGKTTTAAGVGLAAARQGRKVLVITVDPARRLAQALGLGDSVRNDEHEVDDPAVRASGGHLTVTMLDTKAGWDDLVRRHAPDAASAERVLSNGLYANITARFVNSHDYIAMERLHDLGRDDRFDLVVVDTPPSRNALDLLDAPRRMREFFSGRLLRWLTLPYRSRALTLASKPFLQIADRLLGARFLTQIAEFFTLLQAMEPGFVRRAADVEVTLTNPATRCVVVAAPEPASATEAEFLVAELARRGMHAALVVANKVVPAPRVAHGALAGAGAPWDAIATIMESQERIASRHAATIARLATMPMPLVVVPRVSVGAGDKAPASGLEAVVAALAALDVQNASGTGPVSGSGPGG